MCALISHRVWKTGRLLLSALWNRFDLDCGGEGLPLTVSFLRPASEVSHLKNTVGWRTVVFFACELTVSFPVMIRLIRNLHKFCFGFVMNWHFKMATSGSEISFCVKWRISKDCLKMGKCRTLWYGPQWRSYHKTFYLCIIPISWERKTCVNFVQLSISQWLSFKATHVKFLSICVHLSSLDLVLAFPRLVYTWQAQN